MTAEELEAFLAAYHYGILATTNGQQHAIARPIAYTVIGTSFWFATVVGARLRNLRSTPCASLVVAQGDRGDHRAVAVDGPVGLTQRPAAAILDRWEARHGSRPEWAAAWCELTPARLLSYSALKAPAAGP